VLATSDSRDGNAVIGKVRRCLTPETSVNGHVSSNKVEKVIRNELSRVIRTRVQSTYPKNDGFHRNNAQFTYNITLVFRIM